MRTIAYLTDTHLDEPAPAEHGADERRNWQLALADLTTRKIDAIVFGGDIGLFASYPDFFESLSEYPNLFVTPGNHDTSAHVRQFFPSVPHSESGFYQSHPDDDLKWIFLDSSTGKISPEQMDWLQAELQTDKPVLLFVHHPILPVDTYVDQKYPLENRNDVCDLLLRHPHKVTVCCGHYHVQDTAILGNITQWVTPAISYQIQKHTSEITTDATYFGYRIIETNGGNVETEVITLYPDEF